MKTLKNLTKQLITQNLFSSNSLYNKSFFRINAISVIFLFPLFLLLFFYNSNEIERKNLEKKKTIQQILIDTLITNTSYGDLVYARAYTLNLGKKLELVDLGICENSVDILERPNETRCKQLTSENFLKTYQQAYLGGHQFQIEFLWKKEKPLLLFQIIYSFLLSLSFTIIFLIPIQLILLKYILKSVKEIIHKLVKQEANTTEVKIYDEFEPISKLLSEKTEELKLALTDAANVKIASQVSHDIRSPLIALKMAIEDIDSIPKNSQILISNAVNRIDDIANNLINFDNFDKGDKPQLLVPILESIVSEKRLFYRNNLNVTINIDTSKGYGLFAKVNGSNLSRVISNLINNSYEALTREGKIDVSISHDDNLIKILIIDNGKGIPEEIISRLGIYGFSYDKNIINSGKGIGLNHAFEYMKSIGGDLKISSKENLGTTIELHIPKTSPPEWFVDSLEIKNDLRILILDDDISIHAMWAKRIKSNVFVFSNIDDFRKELSLQSDKNFICLIDYEFSRTQINGLDIIEKERIEENSLLVTSHYEDKTIQERVEKLKIKIIPKIFLSSIPIKFKESNAFYDYVYLDDDELLIMTWQSRALKKNINLLCVQTISEFERNYSNVSKENSKIYIDSMLGKDSVRGEEFAKILHDKGYINLYINSGYDQKHFSHLPWLKYSKKGCPF